MLTTMRQPRLCGTSSSCLTQWGCVAASVNRYTFAFHAVPPRDGLCHSLGPPIDNLPCACCLLLQSSAVKRVFALQPPVDSCTQQHDTSGMNGCCRPADGQRLTETCWSASINVHGAACWECNSCMPPVQPQCLPQLYQKPSDAIWTAQLLPICRHSCAPAPMPCAPCPPAPSPYALHCYAPIRHPLRLQPKLKLGRMCSPVPACLLSKGGICPCTCPPAMPDARRADASVALHQRAGRCVCLTKLVACRTPGICCSMLAALSLSRRSSWHRPLLLGGCKLWTKVCGIRCCSADGSCMSAVMFHTLSIRGICCYLWDMAAVPWLLCAADVKKKQCL